VKGVLSSVVEVVAVLTVVVIIVVVDVVVLLVGRGIGLSGGGGISLVSVK